MHTYDYFFLKQIQNVICCCSFKRLDKYHIEVYSGWMEEVIVGQKNHYIATAAFSVIYTYVK